MEHEEDPLKIDQIEGLKEILQSLAAITNQPISSTIELKQVELKSNFRKHVFGY